MLFVTHSDQLCFIFHLFIVLYLVVWYDLALPLCGEIKITNTPWYENACDTLGTSGFVDPTVIDRHRPHCVQR